MPTSFCRRVLFRRCRHFCRHASAVVFSAVLAGCVSQPATLPDSAKQSAAKARVELALGYLQQHQFEAARLNLDKALQHAPDYYLVHSALGYFYQQQGETDNARQAYEKALVLSRSQGGRGDVHNNFGVFLCTQGEADAAFGQFEQALQAANYYAQADTYENIALCAYSVGKPDISRQALQSLQKLDTPRAEKLRRTLK